MQTQASENFSPTQSTVNSYTLTVIGETNSAMPYTQLTVGGFTQPDLATRWHQDTGRHGWADGRQVYNNIMLKAQCCIVCVEGIGVWINTVYTQVFALL